MSERDSVSSLLAAAMAEQGVTAMFGILGDANIAFMSSMSRQPETRTVHTRHESAAVSMAGGHARTTGLPALACVTSGPGLTHATTSVVAACRARLPMVVYAGDTSSGGGFMGGLQEFDQRGFAELTGARFLRYEAGQDPAEVVATAVRGTVEAGVPVLLSVPVDLAESPVAAVASPPKPTVAADPAGPARPEWVAEATDRLRAALAGARRPVLVVGAGAVRADAVERVRVLARRVGAHLAVTYRARGALGDDPRQIGIVGALAHQADQAVLDAADLLVGFGADLEGFGAFGGRLFGGARLAVGEEAAAGRAASVRAAEELRAVLDTVLAADPDSGTRAADLPPAPSRDEAVRSDFAELAEVADDPGRLDPRVLMAEVDKVLPHDTTVVIGAGHFWSFPIMYLPARERRFLYSIEFGSIGLALATGLGAAVAEPGRPVLVVEGDGGALMGVQELETAARSGIPVTLLVLNDGALGAEYHKLAGKGFDPAEAAYSDVDFAAMGRVMGVHGATVTAPDQVAAALSGSEPTRVVDARVSRRVTSRWYRRMYL
ncbi:thiamine pyrophosphate-binding protein [Pseudonocardia sp. NPDC049635]|uniref:thiamine pyrophosphate-binding protein n=1 Tax=Pseudonocardia sp. NPDC049635 TaxID=3155506 RepID=UPI0034110CF2